MWPGRAIEGVRIKICGLTREEEARAAVDLGVDALGFNFYSQSRRALSWPQAAEWIDRLPRAPEVCRVAVVVQPSSETLQEMVRSGVFDLVQFHGGERAEFCAQCPIPYLRAAAASDADWPRFAQAGWLVDAVAAPGEFGGTGKLADWEAAAQLVRQNPGHPIFLAGGLNPHNVRRAVEAVRPWGVDVAGGVESAPGRKDAGLMKALVQAVRAEGRA